MLRLTLTSGQAHQLNDGAKAEARLHDLHALPSTATAELLARTWGARRGVPCIGVDWERWEAAGGLPHLQAVAAALGGRVLSAICRTLATDYVDMCHGLPDLLLLSSTSSSSSSAAAKFVEVKGPRDQLRDAQLAWIDVLVRAGADVDVCHVEAEH